MCMPLPKLDYNFCPHKSILCSYGCGQEAKFRFVNSGNPCCTPSHTSCPANRKKNSNGLKSCGRNYKQDYQNLPQETKDKMAWARGLTKEIDDRILLQAINATGRRRITDEVELKK